MQNRPANYKNINLLGLAYIAIIPVLAFMLSLIPLNTNTTVDLPFLADMHAQQVLAFGEFPDCSTSCPIGLSTLQKIYIHYKELSKR